MESTENTEFKEMKRSLIKTLVIIALSVIIIVSLVPKPKSEASGKHKIEVGGVNI